MPPSPDAAAPADAPSGRRPATTAVPPTSPHGRTTRRPFPTRLLVAALAAATLAAYVAIWAQLKHDYLAGGDGSASYVAAQTWRAGGSVYDQAAETTRHDALLGDAHANLPFITPPTTVLLVAPLTPLDVATAMRLLGLAQLALVAAAVALALRVATRGAAQARLTPALFAMAGLGSAILLWQAQWDGICALALAAAYAAWIRGSPLAAGAAIAAGFGATKPHLAIGLVALLLVAGRGRALAGLALGTAGVVAAGLAVNGAQGWADWIGALRLSSGHSPVATLLGYTGLTGSWLGDTTLARVLAGAASAVAVVACGVLGARLRRGTLSPEPALAAATALSLAAAPHVLTHDLAVLAPAAAWTLAWAAARRPPLLTRVGAAWLGLNVIAILDLGNASSAPPGRLVPLALTACGVAALRLAEQEEAVERARRPQQDDEHHR